MILCGRDIRDTLLNEADKKIRWKGTFNYYGQVIILYRYAKSKKIAKIIFIKDLAKQLSIYPQAVARYFGGRFDNYIIAPAT